MARSLPTWRHEGPGDAAADEEFLHSVLGAKEATEALAYGRDGNVQSDGRPTDAPRKAIRNAILDGMLNLYEGAQKALVTLGSAS
ncbi:MAG: hypothetical protein OXH76_05295 [Boseongicola sp.]|nr:hypothetical protein [Boseongicola sp.]